MKKLLKISILAGFVFTLIFTAVGLSGNIKPLLAVQASTTDTALNTAIVNLYDANFALHNTLIKSNGTETVSNPVFTTSNIMPVETNSTYIYNSYLCYLLAYDNAKNFLGSIPSNGNSLFGGVMQIVHETDYTEVIIPQTTTVKYVRAIFNNPGPSPIFYKTTGDFAADIEIMKSAGVNLVDMNDTNWAANKLLSIDNELTDSETVSTSGYISVQGGNWYTFNTPGTRVLYFNTVKALVGNSNSSGTTTVSGIIHKDLAGATSFYVPVGYDIGFVRVLFNNTTDYKMFHRGKTMRDPNLFVGIVNIANQVNQNKQRIDISLTKTSANTEMMNSLFTKLADGEYQNANIKGFVEKFNTIQFTKMTGQEIIFTIDSIGFAYAINAPSTYTILSLNIVDDENNLIYAGTAAVRLAGITENDETPPPTDQETTETNAVNIVQIVLGVVGGLIALMVIATVINTVTAQTRRRRY